MTDKERFEEIKEKYLEVTVLEYINNVEIVGVDIKDLIWLIKQAEEVEQLQQEIERLKKFLNWEQEEAQWLDKEVTFQLEQLKQMQTKIDRYEKALQKIIDESICKCVDCDFGDTCYAVIARKALDGEEV